VAGAALADAKATLRRGYDEILNRGNFAYADATFAADVVLHAPVQQEPIRGLEAFKDLIRQIRSAFSDMEVTVEDIFGEDDLIAVRFTTRGTQDGDYFGIPPTGRHVTVNEIEFFRVVDGTSARSGSSSTSPTCSSSSG
jgi:steroid delta-isomerase-like uncharacterized protein